MPYHDEMRRAALIVMLSLALAGCSQVPMLPSARVKILAVGDSNTHGRGVTPWPFVLAEILHAEHPGTAYVVDNRAVSGTHSGETAACMEKYLRFRPDIVCIMTGTNDVSGSDWHVGPRQTKAQTEANLRSIITASLAATATATPSGHPLVVLLQPPVAVDRANQNSYAARRWRAYGDGEGANNLTSVKDLCVRLGAEYDIPVVRTWDRFAGMGYDGRRWGPVWMLQDGIHLTESAQKDLARWVRDAIAPSLDTQGRVTVRR